MEIIKRIKNTDELESLSEKLSWQDFEKMVAEILEEHDYSVQVNKVFTSAADHVTGEPLRRAQIDVVATKGDVVLAMDCKHWNRKRHKVSALRQAVDDHIRRCEFISEKIGSDVRPVIVSLFQEDINSHKNVPVVPVTLLNDFLLNCLK